MAFMDVTASDTSIVPAGVCNERFIPLHSEACRPLVDLGTELAGISQLRPPYRTIRTNPMFHVVVYTTGGKGVWRSLEQEGECLPGTIWVCPANTPHEYWVDDYWGCCWFHLAKGEASTRLAAKSIVTGSSGMCWRIHAEMEGLVAEYINAEAGCEGICRMYAEILSAYLRREVALGGGGLADRPDAGLIALRDSVNGNLAYPWTLRAMADAMHCSRSTLERAVHRCYGVSPMKMVTALRVDRIKTLLGTACYTLDEIADMVGYTSGFSMSKAFTKAVGMCPKEYRRLQRLRLSTSPLRPEGGH